MAANYIVINSKFKPFSYEELVKPVQDATLAHQAYETQLAELSSRTDVWENMLNQEQDKELYSIYDNYSNSLKETSDQLAKNGLSPNIRQSLLDLRSRYSKDIIPIENAYNNKKTMMAQQAEARAKDSTALFDVDASQLSLSYFYNNPFASFNQISGKDLTARVSKAVSGLANELTAYGITGKIDPYTNAFMQRTGYTREQILDAINNPNSSERATILNSIVQSVIDSTGVQNWNNSEILDKAYDYANEGLWSAIGRSTITPMDNYGARLAAQMAAKAKASSDRPPLNGTIPIDRNTRTLPSNKAKREKAEELKKTLGYSPDFSKVATYPELQASWLSEGFLTKDSKGNDLLNRARWFNPDGSFVTEEQFINQASNTNKPKKIYWEGSTAEIPSITPASSREDLKRIYEETVTALQELTGTSVDKLNKANIAEMLQEEMIPTRNFETYTLFKGSSAEKVLKNNLALWTSDADDDVTVIKEVTHVDKNGEIGVSDKNLKPSEFIKDDGSLKGTPVFSIVPNPNANYILFQMNTKTYAVPISKLGSLGEEAVNKDLGILLDAVAQRDALIDQYGKQAYESSPISERLDSAIDNANASFIRSMGNALGWELNIPDYDINFTNQNRMP